MKIKSIAFASVMLAFATTSMVVSAQTGAPSSKVVLANGITCSLSMEGYVNLDSSATGVLLSCDSSLGFMQYATALFNPKEYTLSRGARILTFDASGNPIDTFDIPTPESAIGRITGGVIAGIEIAGARGGDPGSSFSIHQMLDDMTPFFASSADAMVRLPPAVSIGPVDPIGHIFCALKTRTKSNNCNERALKTRTKSNNTNERSQKTRTKSNNANDRVGAPSASIGSDMIDEISAQNVRIYFETADGKKGPQVITPISMGAMKLTKADAGRAYDAGAKDAAKIRSWTKDCFDHRTAAFDPSLTNVLQFDISAAEAEKLSSQLQPGQTMRVKVKFPWLCDADCDMTEPLSNSWIERISPSTSRVSILLKPEACRLLPTVNK